MSILKKILSSWLTVDTRVLAIFRVFIGLLSFFDVYRRFDLIDVFYSTAGINLSSSSHSFFANRYFSLIHTFSSPFEVKLLFIITALASISLVVGYRSKLSHFITLLGILSIHNFRILLENGGDMAFNAFLVWSFFLPLGKSLSLDSLFKSLKETKELSTDHLNTRQNKSFNITHFAYFGFIIQLAIIYLFNFINKTGKMWKEGDAVYYMYQLDTFLTSFGAWFNTLINPIINSFLTYGTIFLEASALILILSPIYTKWTRRIAFVCFCCFHIMIGLSVSIGLFSWIMIAALILLLGKHDVSFLKRLLKRVNNRKYVVFYDKDCGFCFLNARILKRFDVFNRIHWADNEYKKDAPKNFKKILYDSIIVYDSVEKVYFTRHIAFSKIISVLPFGFLFSWILRVPLLEKLCGYIYDSVSKNRTKISQFIGLPACGIVSDKDIIVHENKLNSPLSNLASGIKQFSSNFLAFILCIAVINYSLTANEGLEDRFGQQPKGIRSFSKDLGSTFRKIALYPRMSQKWNMFSPTVMRTEKWVVADIEFMNGETTSLFVNNEKVYDKFNRNYFENVNQFWRKFFSRLNKSGNKKYIKDFRQWLRRTDYFSQYDGRRPKKITLWQISERSKDMDSAKKPKVYKFELKDSSSKKSKNSKLNRKKINRN